MKQLSQMIFLSILGEGGLQIILAVGTVIMLAQIFLHQNFTSKARWIVRKKNKEIENNMWLIE